MCPYILIKNFRFQSYLIKIKTNLIENEEQPTKTNHDNISLSIAKF
jgi:hypothetical protein